MYVQFFCTAPCTCTFFCQEKFYGMNFYNEKKDFKDNEKTQQNMQ